MKLWLIHSFVFNLTTAKSGTLGIPFTKIQLCRGQGDGDD